MRLAAWAGGFSSPRGGPGLRALGSGGAGAEGRGRTSLPSFSFPFLRRGVEIKRADPGRPNPPRLTLLKGVSRDPHEEGMRGLLASRARLAAGERDCPCWELRGRGVGQLRSPESRCCLLASRWGARGVTADACPDRQQMLGHPFAWTRPSWGGSGGQTLPQVIRGGG